MNFFVIFSSLALGTIFVENLMRKINKSNYTLKVTMSYSIVCFTIYQISNAYTCWCTTPDNEVSSLIKPISAACSYNTLLIINLGSSFLLGFVGSTLLWAAHFIYINKLSKYSDDSGSYFNFFFSRMQYTRLIGNLLNFIFYWIYFIVMKSLATLQGTLVEFTTVAMGNSSGSNSIPWMD